MKEKIILCPNCDGVGEYDGEKCMECIGKGTLTAKIIKKGVPNYVRKN